jgi:hypothetical protein
MRARNVVKAGAAVAVFALLAAAAPAQTRIEIAPTPQPKAGPPPGYQDVYRLAGITVTDHLYTSDANEVRRVTESGAYQLDGVGFRVLDREYKDSVPLYRFANPAGRHFLHTDRSAGGAEGVRLEGPIGYVDPQPRPGTVPLYAWINPTNGDCFYTTVRSGEQAPQMGMQYRGMVCYVGPVS